MSRGEPTSARSMVQSAELSAPEQTRATVEAAGTTAKTRNFVRVGLATFLVAAFSMAPRAIHRVVEAPIGLDGWPSAYTLLAAGVIGAMVFVVDVIGPLGTTRRARVMFATPMAAPAGLAVWALASVLWTDSPSRTPYEALALTLALLTAAWLGWALTLREQTIAFCAAFHALTLVSTVLAVTQQSARFSDGSWMGLFANPNLLGPVATFGILSAVAVSMWSASRTGHAVLGACVAVDLVAAIKATSATSWLALASSLIVLVLLRWHRQLEGRWLASRHARRIAMASVTGTAVGVFLATPLLASVIDRERSWSYRRETWAFVVDEVRDRPLVGFGFGSFWDDFANMASLSERLGTISGFAHSTFVEALLMLGAVGVALVVMIAAYSVGATLSLAKAGGSSAMVWWCSAAVFALVVNLAESMIAFHSIFWILLVAPGFAAGRFALDASST